MTEVSRTSLQVCRLAAVGAGNFSASRSATTTVSSADIASSQKWPLGYLMGSPTMAQVPGSGIQPRECNWARRTSESPCRRSTKQWSANCGTRVSATSRSVTSSSSELDSRSPIRSSRPIRSLARCPPRRVASRAMITMPVISPDGPRSGAACARTKTRDPSTRWLASVPSHGQPRSTWSAICCTTAASPRSRPSETSERPIRWTESSGKPNSETAKSLAYSSARFRSVTTTPVATCSNTSLAVSNGGGASGVGIISGSPAAVTAERRIRARQSRQTALPRDLRPCPHQSPAHRCRSPRELPRVRVVSQCS